MRERKLVRFTHGILRGACGIYLSVKCMERDPERTYSEPRTAHNEDSIATARQKVTFSENA